MIAPSSAADAEAAALALKTPSADPASRKQLRFSPLAPLAGWPWREGERRTGRPQGDRSEPKKKLSLTRARLRRMKRSARAVLIWGLLCYAVVQLFPLLLKDRWQFVAPANEVQKWPRLRSIVAEQPGQPLLLMLGSSRTCWDFRAGDLDGMADCDGRPLRVYNFGIPATGPIYSLFYLRDMLAEGIRPRFVLIEYLPPLLNEGQRGALSEEGMTGFAWISAHRMRQWLPYLRRPGRRMQDWIEARVAPWYTFRGQLHVELNYLIAGQSLPAHDSVDAWGWHIPPLLPLSAVEVYRRHQVARKSYPPGLSKFRLGKQPTKALRELLDLCRRERIPAALVVMPESSEFRGWYPPEARKAIRGLLDELSRTYGVEAIDGERWLADEDFEDGHHALPHGAEVFTSRLRAELPRLLALSKNARSN